MEALDQAANHLRELGLEVTIVENGLSAVGGRTEPYPVLDETEEDAAVEFWADVKLVSDTWIVRHRQARTRPDRATSLAKAVALVAALFDEYSERKRRRDR